MSEHTPQPPEDTSVELGVRAPCVGCGEGLVACLRPGTDLRTWDGGSEAIYWRHDRQKRVLVAGREYGGLKSWDLASDDDQRGPRAMAYRMSMRDYVGRRD